MVGMFLQYLESERRVSKHTLIAYETDLQQFEQYLAEHYETNPAEATYPMVRGWIGTLAEEELDPRSINRKLACLRSYYKYLMRKDPQRNNPMLRIRSLRSPKKLPHFVRETEIQQLIDHQSTVDLPQLRSKLILEFFYSTGIRLSELIDLEDADVNMVNQTIKVLGKRNKERVIPFPESLKAGILAYRALKPAVAMCNRFFVNDDGSPLKRSAVYRIIRDQLQATTSTKKSPHVLRHSYATHLLNNGAEINAVKELLGHSSLAATQVYTHNSFEQLKKAFDQAHPKA